MKTLFASLILAVSLFTASCEGPWAVTGVQTPVGQVVKNEDGTYTLKPKVPAEGEVGDTKVIQNPDGTFTIVPDGVEAPVVEATK